MGAQLREYRQHIRSAQTMQKVTSAMELIATSRINRARTRMEESNPYARAVTQAVSAVATFAHIENPLLAEPETVKRSAIVLFTSDRGLNGGFSQNVLRQASQLEELLTEQGKEVVRYLVGRKAVGNHRFHEIPFDGEWTGHTDSPDFATARSIGQAVIGRFLQSEEKGGVEKVHILSNRFKSVVSQTTTSLRLLPIEVVDAEEELPDATDALPLYDFEPDADTVLDALLPVYIESRLFNAMLHSAASELAARQRAMKSASDNAQDLVRDYTRLANNARQAEITQQISEIVGGADALAKS